MHEKNVITEIYSYKQFQKEPFMLQGNALPLKITWKYLHVTLDTKVTILIHLLASKKKASFRLKALTILNSRHQGCSSNIHTNLYTATIRPVFSYAHPLFAIAPDIHLSTLDKPERGGAMRLVNRIHRQNNKATVYSTVSIPPLRQLMNNLNKSNYLQKTLTSSILSDFFIDPFTSNPNFWKHFLSHFNL